MPSGVIFICQFQFPDGKSCTSASLKCRRARFSSDAFSPRTAELHLFLIRGGGRARPSFKTLLQLDVVGHTAPLLFTFQFPRSGAELITHCSSVHNFQRHKHRHFGNAAWCEVAPGHLFLPLTEKDLQRPCPPNHTYSFMFWIKRLCFLSLSDFLEAAAAAAAAAAELLFLTSGMASYM